MDMSIHLLVEVLKKKEQILKQIYTITENQAVLLREPSTVVLLKMFKETSEEKQALIEEVLSLDEVFNRTFNKIDDFEDVARLYKDDIRVLQAKIKQVTDIDVKIRVLEKQNETVLKQRDERKITPNLKKDLLEQYEQMKRNNDF